MEAFHRGSLQDKILVLSVSIICFSIVASGAVTILAMKSELQRRYGLEALAYARSFAALPQVKANLGMPGGHLAIQPLAESTRVASGAEFVVAIDMEGIRYSHPVVERIGQHVVGGDEERVLQGDEYVSTAVGTLGPSVRGLAPVYNESHRQVGAVIVGILTGAVKKQTAAALSKTYVALVASLVAGALGSGILARKIKAIMFNMEPDEIAALLQQRNAILSSVPEGIIAVAADGTITLVNDEAQRMLGTDDQIMGKKAADVIPNTRLPIVLSTGEAEYEREQVMGKTVILTNRLPVTVDGKVVGAVASFRDKSEFTRLAEELTGVKRYTEALRMQSHEFRNKLHSIAGLIHLRNYSEALNLIMESTESINNLLNFVTSNIKVSPVAAILIGKAGRAKELGVAFEIQEGSSLSELPVHADPYEFAAVLGNLIDNAIDAASEARGGSGKVWVCVAQFEDVIEVEVLDNGSGIPKDLEKRVWEHGFSTKPNGNGLGLVLVKQIVESMGGQVSHHRSGDMTVFYVSVPRGKPKLQ